MSRRVRMVPPDWQHPIDEVTGRYKPLLEGYADAATEFMEMAKTKGLQEALDYFGVAPNRDDYMPDWPSEQCTHFMMYETTSEGTPKSPAFATAEELAQWLAATGASAFGRETATYEQWLATIRRGYAPTAVFSARGFESGVVAFATEDQKA